MKYYGKMVSGSWVTWENIDFNTDQYANKGLGCLFYEGNQYYSTSDLKCTSLGSFVPNCTHYLDIDFCGTCVEKTYFIDPFRTKGADCVTIEVLCPYEQGSFRIP
jgi:hypothetical protein